MKTNIRTAKSKLFDKSTVFYVPSKSGGDEHIVVHNGNKFFCDCKDFMTRRLPLLGTPGFSACTHGKQVLMMLTEKTYTNRSSCKYGVFTANGQRSIDISATFDTKKAAERFLADYEFRNGRIGRFVKAL